MSQSEEVLDLHIKAIITLDDQKEPQAVSISGNYGEGIPNSGLHSLANEALDSYLGLADHEYWVNITPVQRTEQGTVFEIHSR